MIMHHITMNHYHAYIIIIIIITIYHSHHHHHASHHHASPSGGPENISKGIEDYEAAGELETDEDALKAIKMKIKKVVAMNG